MAELKDTSWQVFRDSMWLQARRTCTPITGTFELTPLCNFRCRMCYVRLDADQLPQHGRLHTADEWIELGRQAMEAGTYRITLTGGEVLTRSDFAEIYSALCDMGLLVSVLSNGSLVDEDVVKLFCDKPPINLRFTLYGASNKTYKRLCGINDGFDRVMRSLTMLKDAGVPFSLAYTETTENIGDTQKAYEIAQSLGCGIVIATDIVPSQRGAVNDAEALRIDSSDLSHLTRSMEDECRNPLADIIGEDDQDLFTGPFASCSMYRTSFWVDWNGYMENCALMSSSRSTPFEDGFQTAWEDLQAKLASIAVPAPCAECAAAAYCETCPGKRESETGHPDGVSTRTCREAFALLASSD